MTIERSTRELSSRRPANGSNRGMPLISTSPVGQDRTVCFWDATSGMERQRVKVTTAQGPELGHSLLIAADGRTIATVDISRTLRLWQLSTGKVLGNSTDERTLDHNGVAARRSGPSRPRRLRTASLPNRSCRCTTARADRIPRSSRRVPREDALRRAAVRDRLRHRFVPGRERPVRGRPRRALSVRARRVCERLAPDPL